MTERDIGKDTGASRADDRAQGTLRDTGSGTEEGGGRLRCVWTSGQRLWGLWRKQGTL